MDTLQIDQCEICIVGAGIAGLNALFAASQYLGRNDRVVLVDRRTRVGGMWTDTYDYVRLHQPYQLFTAGNIKWTLGKERSYLATTGLAITPVAHAAAAAARLSVSSTWQTGFIAHFTVVNASTAPMTDWRLEFDLPAGESVSHTWSSTLVQYGTHYVLTPANWNRIIAPGGSATGGLRGVLTGFYTPPSNCVLNGQYPCT